MVRVDTLKLQLPLESVNFDKNKAEYHSKQLPNSNEVRETYIFNKGVIGFKSLSINQSFAVLEVSAKVLGNDYLGGINPNTIERLFDSPIGEGFLINKNIAIDQGKILKADFTNHINIGEFDKGFIIDELGKVPFASNSVYTEKFNNKHEIGFIMRKTAKTVKNRLTIYDKQKELLSSGSKEFNKKYPMIYNQSKNLLRVESNLTKFKSIRDFTNQSDTLLKNVLNSGANVNFQVFSDYVKNLNEPVLNFSMFGNDTLKNIILKSGYYGIFDQFNGDWKQIEQFIRFYSNQNNVRRTILKFKEVYKLWISEKKVNKVVVLPKIIEFIKDGLSKAS